MTSYVTKTCVRCGNLRKFICGSRREKTGICGNCWDWEGANQQLTDYEKK